MIDLFQFIGFLLIGVGGGWLIVDNIKEYRRNRK